MQFDSQSMSHASKAGHLPESYGRLVASLQSSVILVWKAVSYSDIETWLFNKLCMHASFMLHQEVLAHYNLPKKISN